MQCNQHQLAGAVGQPPHRPTAGPLPRAAAVARDHRAASNSLSATLPTELGCGIPHVDRSERQQRRGTFRRNSAVGFEPRTGSSTEPPFVRLPKGAAVGKRSGGGAEISVGDDDFQQKYGDVDASRSVST